MPIGFFSIRNIEELDFNKLVRQLPGGGGWNPFSTRGAYIRAILESYPLLQQHEINTPMRLAHFLGQGLVETGCFAHRAENLNYSASRLRQIFPGYFPTEEVARQYERKPERIANRVYANRLGNGPPESGDGWRYRGRGFFQLTGRENYRRYGEVAGVDLENEPELIERDLKKSLQVAAAYFQHMGLGAYADRNDCAAVSRGVNRGNPRHTRPAHGEADRILWTNKALDLVKDPQALLARTSTDGVLRVGASGEEVRKLQRALSDLGYPVGAVDGIFGPATRRAVLAFQDEFGLPTTGEVDAATRAELDKELAGPIEVNAPPPLAPLETGRSPSLDPAQSSSTVDLAPDQTAPTTAQPMPEPQPPALGTEAPSSASAPSTEAPPDAAVSVERSAGEAAAPPAAEAQAPLEAIEPETSAEPVESQAAAEAAPDTPAAAPEPPPAAADAGPVEPTQEGNGAEVGAPNPETPPQEDSPRAGPLSSTSAPPPATTQI